MRSISELVDVVDPAWPGIIAAIDAAGSSCRVLPPIDTHGGQCLYRLQVTARSTLGAIALNTGAVLIDHGWLRLLGAGSPGLPDLASINLLDNTQTSPGALLVAFDVVGGRFAINGGALPGPSGEVHYWGPDTLKWDSVGLGYSDFVHWALTDRLGKFASALRWQSWREEIASLGLDNGVMFYPPQCTVEGRDRDAASRKAVPFGELQHYLEELASALDGE